MSEVPLYLGNKGGVLGGDTREVPPPKRVLYTLHPAPYALHPTPSTILPKPSTPAPLHPKQQITNIKLLLLLFFFINLQPLKK